MASRNVLLSCFYSIVAGLVLLGPVIGQRRNLTDITYEYRSCGVSGRLGPPFATCEEYYKEKQSRIHKDQVLFQFENGDYLGAQGFRVPSTGTYNITIAGASGGWGLCSVFQGGYAYERTIHVHLTPEEELLVMVGQQGRGPCDVIPNSNPVYSAFCVNRPMFTEDIENCTSTWINTNNTNPDFYAVFGGAGGGGASMVRARNKTSRVFESFPIVISPGGAGTPALVDYDIIRVIDSDAPIGTFFSTSLAYRLFINGQSREFDSQYSAVGIRGARINVTDLLTSAGTGGGYNTGIVRALDQDGQALSTPQNFALGGVDCLQFLGLRIAEIPFKGAFGGFGGGGGACGGSGAGGGYTGGPIFRQGLTIPGAGGFSYVGDFFSKFIITEIDPQRTLGDVGSGYVDIVRADCGCVHECVVYNAEREFECLCPNGTFIAPDLSDCFEEKELIVGEGIINSLPSGVIVRQLSLNSSVHLLSVRADVQVSPLPMMEQVASSQSIRCFLVVIGEGPVVILVSNVVSGSGRIDSLSSVTIDFNGNATVSGNMSTLDSSVGVTGMFLVSTGDCHLVNSSLRAGVSIQESDLSVTNISLVTNTSNGQLYSNLFSELLMDESTEPLPGKVVDTGVVVGSVIGAFVAAVLILALIIFVAVVCYRRQSNNSDRLLLHKLSLHQGVVNQTDSLQINTAYIRYEAYPSREMNESPTDPGYDTVYIEPENDATNSQFKTRYGVSAPDVDFSNYNRQRSNTLVKNWKYPRSNLIYMRELGEGQFGKVLLMKATDIAGYKGKIPVAVKTLTSRDPEVIQKFLEEADLMKKFSHPNIVSLLGFITEEKGEDSAPLMILEYMPYGDLQGFLTKHRPDSNGVSLLKKLHFYTFAYDIAKGLEFLSERKYVHRDVAARNCLVGTCLQIKIADFGLARGVYDKDYYRIAGSAVLPVRWMAPECLMFGKFSSASDVWAYGVMLWEILTFGQLPLEELEVTEIIEAAQQRSLRHSRPYNSPDDLYELMYHCHEHQVEDRPSFTNIVQSSVFNIVKNRPSLNSAEVDENQSAHAQVYENQSAHPQVDENQFTHPQVDGNQSAQIELEDSIQV